MQYKINTIKLIIFFAIISFSISVIMTIISSSDQNYSHEFIFLGTVLGPMVSLFFMYKKGIYNTCILLIFLTEVSLLCSSLYEDYFISNIIAPLFLGVSLTSTLVLCPVITYYLRGPIPFVKAFCAMIIVLFGGLLMANPLSLLPKEIVHSTFFVLTIISLLLGSFFAVFSAWRHRLVLLK